MLRSRTAVEPWTLSAAYERCRQLHARHGRTYYLATRLLPGWKRRPVHALYGFTRYADEIVDDLSSTLDPAAQATALQAFGEVYLPAEDLERFGVSREDLAPPGQPGRAGAGGL